MDIFDILILAGLLAVLTALGFGLYALFRGGDIGRSYSNKMMRLRVVAQFVTILLILIAAYFHHRLY